jgi:hypothetical protein
MKGIITVILSCLLLVGQLRTQTFALTFHNDRLKTLSLPTRPISGNDRFRGAEGFWIPESTDPAKALILPQQVNIRCYSYKKECAEISVSLGVTKNSVSIQDHSCPN